MNISAGENFLSFIRGGVLKSTRDRMQRQQETEDQVNFLEAQKDNLKNVVCESPEEIQRKLEIFQSYDDRIAAAKAAYNHEQMSHMMDEAKEIGEKIAEAVEKSKPKTPEERKEEIVEEVLGIEEQDGLLSEIMDQIEESREFMEDAGDGLETMPESKEMKTLTSLEADEIMKMTEDRNTEKVMTDRKNNIYRSFDVKI